jgi:hypothetical protein
MAKSIEIDRSKRLREEPHKGHNRWHPDIAPVIEAAPGEEVTLETRDANDLQINLRTTIKDLEKLERTVAHPLTGPVYVKGAQPGDMQEDFALERDEAAAQDPLPPQSVGTVCVRLDVVDVLDEDDVGTGVGEVGEERSVARWAQHQSCLIGDERSAAGRSRDRVRRGLLDGKRQIEPRGERSLVGGQSAFPEQPEGVYVLGGNGEPHTAHAVAVAHEPGRLDQMLLKRRSGAVRVAMKRDQSLGDRGVSQAIGADQRIDDLGAAPGAAQDVQVVPAKGELRT